MKKIIFVTVLFFVVLSACISPNQDIQNTAVALAQTGILQTETAKPTVTPTLTATATIVLPTPSPLPTQPSIFMITPNAVQVERWREYEIALAKKLISSFPVELVLCEWEILGEDVKKIYVFAVCVATGYEASKPAVIFLNENENIQEVEFPRQGSKWKSDIENLFPVNIQEKILSYNFSEKISFFLKNIELRKNNIGQPPFIITLANN